ncbi:MAG: hypothetical protein ACO3RV_05860 [Luteolibacter sp.]
MHHFRQPHQRFRLLLCSLSFVLCGFSILGAGGLMLAGLILGNRELMWYALGWFAFGIGTGLIYLLTMKSAKCPLCRGELMCSHGYVPHKRALRLFGSVRMGVAIPALLLQRFRCPYCGEPCSCRPKDENPVDHGRPSY